MANGAKQAQRQYGWHWLAKDIADYTNISTFEVYDKPAMEIFGTIMIMQAKARYNESKQ